MNVSSFVKVDPEDALRAATEKVIRRFALVEEKARAQDKDMKDMTLAQLDALWDSAKKDLKGEP